MNAASLVAHLDSSQAGDQEVASLTPPGWQHSFMEIDHEIFLQSFSPFC